MGDSAIPEPSESGDFYREPESGSGDAATFGTRLLDGFKIDVSHQEMERIMVEIEMIYKTQPGKWLPIHVSST